MINYPIKKDTSSFKKLNNTANRGMALEEMINRSNTYYMERKIAYVNKRPTNIKVLKTEDNYQIKEAVFLAPSTLDYVGVYQGKYLDFEAKETISNKGFPMDNIKEHQLKAIADVLENKGISFVIIFLKAFNEVYLVDGKIMLETKEKILSYERIKEVGHLIKEGYNLPLDYIKIVRDIYF